MDNKIKHLEFIQNVISRMAHNSFSLKEWAVTLIAGVFVLGGKDTKEGYFLIAYLPVLVFWFLDSFYLYQERLYRKLYDIVREKQDNESDFDMNTKNIPKERKQTYGDALLSKTEIWFYIPIALIVALVLFFV